MQKYQTQKQRTSNAKQQKQRRRRKKKKRRKNQNLNKTVRRTRGEATTKKVQLCIMNSVQMPSLNGCSRHSGLKKEKLRTTNQVPDTSPLQLNKLGVSLSHITRLRRGATLERRSHENQFHRINDIMKY
jgi:hypothetical protein